MSSSCGDRRRTDVNGGAPRRPEPSGERDAGDGWFDADGQFDADEHIDTGAVRPLGTNPSRSARRNPGRIGRRWVPESLQDARIDPGPRGALVLSLVAALAACGAAAGVWLNRPESVPVPELPGIVAESLVAAPVTDPTTMPDSSSGAGAGATAGIAATTNPTVPIVVSVTGLVRREGLVTLPPGARVADAVAAAGGVIDGAELAGINLAARLADGDSVVIGPSGSSGVTPGPAAGVTGVAPGVAGGSAVEVAPVGPLNLNTATSEQLQELPGVGPVTAEAIIAFRTEVGSFATVDQLQDIPGIGEVRFARLAPLVTVR